MNVESIAEVKVLVSNYQAEYGRASGVQITAVTKSGTNRFRGSLYDVERNSDWNSNSKTNILNGDPKTILKQRDWGFSLGGPVGKPGGSNRIFFFYTQEFEPRTAAMTCCVPLPDRGGARRRLLRHDRQQRQPVAVHPRCLAQRRLLRGQHSRLLRRWRRRSARSPRTGCISRA